MTVQAPISAAILCGGKGRRLGGVDKGQLVAEGRSFVDRLVEALQPLTHDLMLIDSVATRIAPSGVRLVADLLPGTGPLGAIVTALHEAEYERVAIVACDMPFVTTAFLQQLADWQADADVVIPRDDDGRYPLCAVVHRHAEPVLRARIESRELRVEDALGSLRVRAITRAEYATWDTDGRLLLNVNTPEEYQETMKHTHRESTRP